MQQAKLFRIAIFAAITWTIVMKLFSPSNIVQFELARTTAAASEIITNWGPGGIALARTSTYLDFIYLILYSAAIALGCSVSAKYPNNATLLKIGTALSFLTFVAGGCDAVENIAMLKSLQAVTQTTVSIAYYFAITKFTILSATLIFILAAFATGAFKKLRS